MMQTPIALADSLRIGTISFVAPDEFKVTIDIDAPNDIALNAGIPRPFPRINGYVVIPNESGYIVAQIEWITVENSQYPKRKGLQDFGIIDLPFPLRKMSINPLGVLRENVSYETLSDKYAFSRGIEVFPSIGDPVLLPSQEQLIAIIESGENKYVKIGVSPLAGNANVYIDPDKLFGRHLAVLGNTGSGKSCSVAGLIRWSIESAQRQNTNPNYRFIVLDPNGEYSKAFQDIAGVKCFAAENDTKNNIKQLRVPLWFWNSAEWCAFTQASPKTQKPTLIQALRSVRDGQLEISSKRLDMRRYLRTIVTMIRLSISNGAPWSPRFPEKKGFFDCLEVWHNGLIEDDSFEQDETESLLDLRTLISSMIDKHTKEKYPTYLYNKIEINKLLNEAIEAHIAFGGSDKDISPIDADIPIPFTGESLLRSVEANAELLHTTDYIDPLLTRIQSLLSDARLTKINSEDTDITLEKWLDEYLCFNNGSNGGLTIIDLSLIPSEVTHIIIAVIARIILEALQRYRQMNNGKTLPTTIVMEEAHTFIKKYVEDSENATASKMCAQVFEKIAREGRKFGLGLVLSSQRPSELSPTVLSQCNTFILHRINNDQDLKIVNSLVPDNLRALLRDLPSLPSGKAIFLGWATELPVLVQMNYLDENHRPQSNDPKYWDSWTITENVGEIANWDTIAKDWQNYSSLSKPAESNSNSDKD